MKKPASSREVETALTSSVLVDPAMKLFTAIAMVLVVVGHIDATGFMGPFNLFPPYSFQVAAFVFVSGYFYNNEAERSPARYILKKIKRLILPMYFVMFAYGMIAFVLLKLGFNWGQTHAPSSFLLSPFTNGHQFIINMPMWFIAPLFCAEIANLAIREIVSFFFPMQSTRKEAVLFLLYLALGSIAIIQGGAAGIGAGWKLLMCRTLFFLACFAMGRFYRSVLKEHDNLGSISYFSIVITLQLILFALCNGQVSYIPSWCQFPNGVLLTYLVTFTGIAFLMRISKIFGVLIGNTKTIRAIADNTFSIMCHHYFGFFIISCFFAGLSHLMPLSPPFDWVKFYNTYYFYFPFNQTCWSVLYSVFGIAFSISIHKIWLNLRNLLSHINHSFLADNCRK